MRTIKNKRKKLLKKKKFKKLKNQSLDKGKKKKNLTYLFNKRRSLNYQKKNQKSLRKKILKFKKTNLRKAIGSLPTSMKLKLKSK